MNYFDLSDKLRKNYDDQIENLESIINIKNDQIAALSFKLNIAEIQNRKFKSVIHYLNHNMKPDE